MIKNISISTFINVIFSIAFIAIIVTFGIFFNLDKQKHRITQQNRYELIAENFLQTFNNKPSKEDLKKLYIQFKVQLVDNRELKINILNEAEELLFKRTYLGTYRIYIYKDDYYLYAQQLGYNLMLKDLHSNRYNITILVLILIFSLSTILFLYIILRKKLKPLRLLNDEIKKFAKGDLDIHIKQKTNDEIGDIAKSFNKAITQINNQTKSKNLFMRNMMHELKTPITKAMFIAETLEDEKSKQMLQKAFRRMDDIIKELATVEKITSNTSIVYKELTRFFKVYEKSLEISMANTQRISSKIHDFTFEADTNLLSVALKNLIDNGIKFSTDSKVRIIANKDKIQVISKGEKLKYDLDYYTEPFSQEEKRSKGFGLGLYIVDNIIKLHKFHLRYFHRDGENYFVIYLDSPYS